MRDDVYLKKLGSKILKLRTDKGISQMDFAAAIGSSDMQVRRVERGMVNSSINMLRKIAKQLDVSIASLVTLE